MEKIRSSHLLATLQLTGFCLLASKADSFIFCLESALRETFYTWANHNSSGELWLGINELRCFSCKMFKAHIQWMYSSSRSSQQQLFAWKLLTTEEVIKQNLLACILHLLFSPRHCHHLSKFNCSAYMITGIRLQFFLIFTAVRAKTTLGASINKTIYVDRVVFKWCSHHW